MVFYNHYIKQQNLPYLNVMHLAIINVMIRAPIYDKTKKLIFVTIWFDHKHIYYNIFVNIVGNMLGLTI